MNPNSDLSNFTPIPTKATKAPPTAVQIAQMASGTFATGDKKFDKPRSPKAHTRTLPRVKPSQGP